MEALKIILLAIGAAVFYGILHDQVTVRVCVEYFTIGHPPVFQTDSPTLLGLGWGVIATWWVGLILGIPMACSARIGQRPPLPASSLLKPIAMLLAVMAVLAVIAGLAGFAAARAGAVWLVEPMRSAVPIEKHVFFIANLWSHLASYGVGFLGGIVLCVRIWRRRGRMEKAS
jgi:hypothetical protein